MDAILRIGEHQAAFRAERGGWPAFIHVNYKLVASLAASPWRVHFNEERWLECNEGYLAQSVLVPETNLSLGVMWSPADSVPDWSGEHY